MYLGIEIGGTKLQAGLGCGDGTLTAIHRVRARPDEGRRGICQQLIALVSELLKEQKLTPADLIGVGIGFGGPVDSHRGLILKSHQVSGWENFPLLEWFEKELGIAAVLGNDSDLAGLAEASHGAGRGFSPVVYMNIGSGIGGALVIDGKLFAGQGMGAAEIGHLRILPAAPGEPWQTLESLCSGWSLAESARNAVRQEPASLLANLCDGEVNLMTTEILVSALRQECQTAAAIWQTALERLGVAIANVITLLCPQRVVLGGGVAGTGEILFGPLRQAIRRQQFAPFSGTWELVPAALGEEVVVHGAIRLAADASKK